jgi:hypothetical protein
VSLWRDRKNELAHYFWGGQWPKATQDENEITNFEKEKVSPRGEINSKSCSFLNFVGCCCQGYFRLKQLQIRAVEKK